ncbi:uncharacterized protein LOC131893679 isoform X2 [Tigriopus californicus]|uniref:uncharacterized protein LOC131893679 isoform X2 n=1 Tax=Tigriopus californicus TaxID=6832 RepID=UPI0027DA591A|nr:uncharacterized protein LOC131893679 isoform X2 [Tigriopus californicus]
MATLLYFKHIGYTLLWMSVLIEIAAMSTTNFTDGGRGGKVLSIFQIVQFQNGPCNTTGVQSGTCYTQSECDNRGGRGAGTCAGGFGVCCIINLACGGTSSENCTYLVQSSTTATNEMTSCQYTICPCDKHICRLRFDFESFNINGPVTGSAISDVTVSAATELGGVIGDCTTDTFSITSPGNFAPPVICGFNTGQHMIVDACAESCNEAIFDLAGSGTRQWNIKVTQYACGDENGGPDGCLQYFTGTTGTVSSYNFPTQAAVLDSSPTHLSSQTQTMCWRQEENTCAICWIPEILGSTSQTGSFGLSISAGNNKARGEVDGKCRRDYLLIPDAQSDVDDPTTGTFNTFIVGTIGSMERLNDRLCGRFLTTADDGGTRRESRSVCTQQRPFRMTFLSDEDEVTESDPPPVNSAQENELNRIPGGIVGFNLRWTLQTCP